MGMITEDQLRDTLQKKIDESIDNDDMTTALSGLKEALLGGVGNNFSTLASIFNLIMDGKILNNDYFNLAVVEADRDNIKGIELWLLINAKYDQTTKRFQRIDIDNFSFAWQMQAGGTYPGEASLGDVANQGMNLWKANGRKAYATGSTAYTQTGTDIGTTINGVWKDFGVMLGWNNVFMNDSYGGMTIGGNGFEVDGNGTSPYKRMSLDKFNGGTTDPKKTPQDYQFIYNGTLWNAYHGLYSMDNKAVPSYWWGMQAPIDWHDLPGGKFDPYSCRAELSQAHYTVCKLPAEKTAQFENWETIFDINCETGDINTLDNRMVARTLVVPVTIVSECDFNMNYPDSTWNKDNTMILGVIGTTKTGDVKQNGAINATYTQYGVYGYLGTGFVSAKLIITKY